MSDSPSAPPPVDYKAAAQAGQTNQFTPLGNSTWTPAQDAIPGKAAVPATQGHYITQAGSGGTDRGGSTIGGTQVWVPGTAGSPAVDAVAARPAGQTTTLSPDLQSGLMGITGRVAGNMGKPPDLTSVPQIADKAYGAMTARLDPQWTQNQNTQETALRNQGLVPGGEAYDNAMRVFSQAKNDAYQQANLGAISTMPQTYQLAMDQYDRPLNELNAIRTGAQVNGPQFQQPPDYLGAAGLTGQQNMGLYNAQVGQQNAMTSGLFGLGGMGLLALSDRRLKRDIRKVADDERGFGIYRYRYLDDDRERIGVMADEVEKVIPEAVATLSSGYQAVDYGRLYG